MEHLDLPTQCGSNMTPLHLAYKENQTEMINFLIALGANEQNRDSFNRLPIDCKKRCTRPLFTVLIFFREIMRFSAVRRLATTPVVRSGLERGSFSNQGIKGYAVLDRQPLELDSFWILGRSGFCFGGLLDAF